VYSIIRERTFGVVLEEEEPKVEVVAPGTRGGSSLPRVPM